MGRWEHDASGACSSASSDTSSDIQSDFGPVDISDKEVVSDDEDDEDTAAGLGVRIGSSMQRPRRVVKLSSECRCFFLYERSNVSHLFISGFLF